MSSSSFYFSEHPNVVDLFHARAHQYADKTAFVLTEASASWRSGTGRGEQTAGHSSSRSNITYKQVWQDVIAIAATLQQQKAFGERVLIIQKPGLGFITAYLGCLCAGAIAVPAYPPRKNHHFERLQSILASAEARFVLTDQQNIDKFQAQAQNWPALGNAIWIASDSVPPELAAQWLHLNIPSDHLAMLQYTSGSTGRPKGVMIQHQHLLHNAFLIHECFQTHDAHNAVNVCWLPPYHDMGLIGGILQPLTVGASTVLMDPVAFLQRPIRWLEAIHQYRGVVSGAPNFAYSLCSDAIKLDDCADFDLSSWEIAFVGAEPIKAQVLEKFAKKFAPLGFKEDAFLPCYGMAEATLMVAGRKGLHQKRVDTSALREHRVVEASADRIGAGKAEEESKAENLVSCGLPIDKVQVKIVDPHTCKPCTTEEIGEIWVSSDSIAAGYWRSPQLTQETFIEDDGSLRFLRTGDMGFLDKGELYVTGRLKELMIIRGRNFYPQDIEQAVQASYVGLRSNNGAAFTISVDSEEALVVVQEVERTALRKLDKDAAIKAIRRAVAEQFELQTAAIILVKPAQLPKTTSGKIQRGRCREKLLDRSLTVVHSWSTLPDLCNESAPRSSSTLDEAPVSSGVQAEAVDNTQGAGRWQQLIRDWLIESISKHLKIQADQLKLREPLADYGLSSLVAVRLSGELQDWLELPLDPTLLYDYPTIEALSEELAKRKQNTASKRSSADSPSEISLPSHPQRRQADGDIAVIGMGCRFPGAATLDDYWELLLNGEDAVQAVPPDRWDIDAYYDARSGIEGKMTTRHGGFIENVDRFDAQFFKISPREAASMDPQQRLLLEVAWETLEQAGIAPSTLKGSRTGVFVGMSSNDYSRLKLKQQLPPTAYFGTSHALSIASNRLSYVMDWRGPSVTVDTACSSSLVAIHQACQSLKMKDCDLAIAGGVNLILDPDLTVVFSQAQMMAADGRCKTFDAAADGYVRGEGCGMVLLKPLSAAQRDGDTIFGVIKGSAVNQDGRSNGLTAPNAQSQQAVITQALQAARVYPDQVSYIEAHGTGTALGDPIEVNALKAVFEPGRSPQNPLYIGSVKTNIGHLESAAGMAGFIKVLLSLHHRVTVPTLHCKQINPLIDIANTPLEIAQSKQLWQEQSTPRYHGVSSFGFGGTNAHLVVSEAPKVLPISSPAISVQKSPNQKSFEAADGAPVKSLEQSFEKNKRPCHLLTLSAATPEALQAQVEQYRKFVFEHPEVTLGDLCFSANATRERLAWRTSLVIQSRDDLLRQLVSLGAQQRYKSPAVAAGRCTFLFAKQGNPWQVGHQLYATQPQFRVQLDRCDEILQPIWKRSLTSLLYTDVDGQSLLQESYYGRPALFAVQYAIANLWMSWGIVPSSVMGDGLSELIAACAAGTKDLQAALKQAVQQESLPQAVSPSSEQQNTRVSGKARDESAYDLAQLAATGCEVCIEIAPGALQQPSAQQNLLFVPTIGRTQEDWKTLFSGLAALDRLGMRLNWHKIDGPYGKRLSNLPTYPFQRQRCWFDNSNGTSSLTADITSHELTSNVAMQGTATAVSPSQIQSASKSSAFSNGSSSPPSELETNLPSAVPLTNNLPARLDEFDSSETTSDEAMSAIEQVIGSQLSVLETLMAQQLAVLEGGMDNISLSTSPSIENGPLNNKPLKNKPIIDEPLAHELKQKGSTYMPEPLLRS